MQSKATAAAAYLRELPPERREVVAAVRKTILDHLPKGYEEVMQYGMLAYVVPLSAYPAGYLDNDKVPLPYAGLAAQKNSYSVYLSYKDGGEAFAKAYRATGKKLDMGKSCVRFKKLDDLPLPLVGKAVAAFSMKEFISFYEAERGGSKW
jgi:hypothetical protein